MFSDLTSMACEAEKDVFACRYCAFVSTKKRSDGGGEGIRRRGTPPFVERAVFTGRMDGLVSHSSEEGRWEYRTHRGTIRKLPGLGSRSVSYWGPALG